MSSSALNPTSLRYKSFCDTNDDLPHPRDLGRSDLADHIPGHHNIMTSTNDATDAKLKCCCGKPDCAYLEHNTAAVDDIERKLERAAQLGQVRAPSRMFSSHALSLACVAVSAVVTCVTPFSNLRTTSHTSHVDLHRSSWFSFRRNAPARVAPCTPAKDRPKTSQAVD